MEDRGFCIESDGDQPVVATVSVEFDGWGELQVELAYEDYRRPEREGSRSRLPRRRARATVDRADAERMARRLGKPVAQLPAAFEERWGDAGVCLPPRQVEAIFGEMLEFILDCGVQYRLRDER